MTKNYYIILGIPSDSSQEDIKAAYRRLAKKFHPDHYGKNQIPFQIIQEAYAILGNPSSRKAYDTSLHPPAGQVSPAAIRPLHRRHDEDVEPLVPDDAAYGYEINAVDKTFPRQRSIVDYMFDRSQPCRISTEDVTIEITLSSIQAERGGNVHLKIPLQLRCPSCYRYSGLGYTCWRCNGAGILQGEKPVLISYPAGIMDNHTMKLAISDFGEQPLYLKAIFKIN